MRPRFPVAFLFGSNRKRYLKLNPDDQLLEFTHGRMKTRHPINGIIKAELEGEHAP